jgi:hypothetical protein
MKIALLTILILLLHTTTNAINFGEAFGRLLSHLEKHQRIKDYQNGANECLLPNNRKKCKKNKFELKTFVKKFICKQRHK